MGQQETAKQIWDYLVGNGWSKSAVAALLGNMQSESGIIADRWESDIVGNRSGGYGLVQWTPASKYIDWAYSMGLDYRNVYTQCKRIEWEVENHQQFYCPSMTFHQFKTSNASPEELANIFIKYYERPLDPNQPVRAEQARYWYNLLENVNPAPKVKVIDWFNKHRGHITYSMDYSRNGSDGTADCSGSITQAVYESTGVPYDYLYSTVTLGGYLAKCGYGRVLVGDSSAANLHLLQDEDIILLSAGSSMADSGGAGGHTGVISGGGKNITSTCYYTEGQANTAIQDLPFNANYMAGEFNYFEVWRPSGYSVSITPPTPVSFATNVYYGLRVLGGSWLGEITNFNNVDSNGFAGLPFNSHDMLYIRVDKGELRYRTHSMESGWLDWVSQGNPNDLVNGCAGNPGEAIDGVQIYYTTPEGETLSQAYYRSQTVARSGWLPVCCDDGTSIAGYDGWAGMFGEPLDRLQIGIATSDPFHGSVNSSIGGSSSNTNTNTIGSTLHPEAVESNRKDVAKKHLLKMYKNFGIGKAGFEWEKTIRTEPAPNYIVYLTPHMEWNITGEKYGMSATVSNGKVNLKPFLNDIANSVLEYSKYLRGDYKNFEKVLNEMAPKVDNGAVAVGISTREGLVGTKILLTFKVPAGNVTSQFQLVIEIYNRPFASSPLPLPAYKNLVKEIESGNFITPRNVFYGIAMLGVCAAAIFIIGPLVVSAASAILASSAVSTVTAALAALATAAMGIYSTIISS